MQGDFALNAARTEILVNVNIGGKQIVAVSTRDGLTFRAGIAGVGEDGREAAIADARRRVLAAPQEFEELRLQLQPPPGEPARLSSSDLGQAIDNLRRLAMPIPRPPHLRGRLPGDDE